MIYARDGIRSVRSPCTVRGIFPLSGTAVKVDTENDTILEAPLGAEGSKSNESTAAISSVFGQVKFLRGII